MGASAFARVSPSTKKNRFSSIFVEDAPITDEFMRELFLEALTPKKTINCLVFAISCHFLAHFLLVHLAPVKKARPWQGRQLGCFLLDCCC
jgi:hypothetical protein